MIPDTRARSSLLIAAFALSVGCAAGNPVGGDAGDGGLDAARGYDAGLDAGSDAGPIEMVGLCESCAVHEQCGSLARCIALTDGEFACAAVCNPDIPSCPRGFECVIRPAAADFPVCAPIGERCCVDQDADGYGRGVGCNGPDCDDEAMGVNPGASELCNGLDDDCDDTIDEEAFDCGTQSCDAAGPAFEERAPGACIASACVDGEATSCGQYACSGGSDEGDTCATTCAVMGLDTDLYCILFAHCDLGICEADLPNGDACDEPSDCTAGHCQNGFCCDDGDCCAVESDCPSVGGLGTTCDDSATCQGSRGEIICQMNQCTTRAGVPDDTACDASTEANTCGLFDSVFCSGSADQTVPGCATTCASDDECDVGAHCDTVCVPDVPDGGLCDENSDCTSTYCTNNICCRSGDCCRDSTDCPASYRTDPVCGTPTACQGTRDAATCIDFVCGTSVGVEDDSACTSSVLADMCGLYPSRFCTGSATQIPPMCAMACTSDSECDAGAHCDLMACVPDLPDGDACDETSDCVSGYCANGFCCASGDCCSVGTDCPFGTYGVASVCTDGTMCQGSRNDPSCSASNQCQTGAAVPDDSGCLGLQSNACGLYPAVFCTNAVSQPPDQASLCAMMCGGDGDCDLGAFCAGGVCTPRGMTGDACTVTPECESGLQCVDGVCCTSSCTGTCVACNVAGSAGTCTDIPNDSDPAGECDGFSCSTYYAGWSGDACYRRLDAGDANVACNGGGTCQGPADVCPGQPQGPLQTDCDDLCQAVVGGTCSGTSAGVCSNVTPSPATNSCGIGECGVTMNRCNSGTQVTCMPDPPGTETCNNLNDDCDGATDEGLPQDAWDSPSNDTCSTSRHLGEVNTANPGATVIVMPTLYPSGDADYFSINANETDSNCYCCGFWCSDGEDIGLSVRIEVPAGAGSYELCLVGTDDACPEWSNCTTVSAGSAGTRTAWRGGCCSPFGCNENERFTWRVRAVATPGFECLPYTLTIGAMGGCG